MTAPQPATIASDIEKRIWYRITFDGVMLGTDTPGWTELWDDCGKLQQVDVVAASLLKADLFQLSGNIERVEYWTRNAERNGGRTRAQQTLATAYANLGFATRAAELYREVMRPIGQHIVHGLLLGTACASFEVMIEAAARYMAAGGDVGQKEGLQRAMRAQEALKALGVGEEKLRLMMDEAGAIMRARHLLWLREEPDVYSSPLGGSPALALNYRVRTSPDTAAQMTWELAERLAAKDLMPDFVTVGFIGQVGEVD